MVLNEKLYSLKRLIGKSKLQNQIEKISIIHLEGYTDAQFLSDYISRSGDSYPRDTRIAYSKGKTDAIAEHRNAIEQGYRIVTVVDMDYDFFEEEINGFDQIFTTKCACTLLTMQFQEAIGKGILSEKLSEQSIYNFMDNYQDINKQQVLNEVVKLTFEKLNGGFNLREKKKTGKKGYYFRHEKLLKKNGIKHPINDHILVSVIANHVNPDATGQEAEKIRGDIEQELVKSALLDKNQSVHRLASKVLMSLNKA